MTADTPIARVVGQVVPGDGRGATLGFPTANLAVTNPSDLPADGAYACWVYTPSGERHGGTVSVGFNPTFPGVLTRRVEVFVHDFSESLYDREIRVDFLIFLHHMVTFKNVPDLIAHTHELVEQSQLLLRELA